MKYNIDMIDEEDKKLYELYSGYDDEYDEAEAQMSAEIARAEQIAADDKKSQDFTKTAKENNKKLHGVAPHKDHRLRMYAKYRDSLFYDFEDHEVLEMILYNCYLRQDTNGIAINLIKHFGCFENVINANIDELMLAGLTERSAIIISQYNEVQKFLHFYNRPKNDILINCERAGEYCASRYGYDVNEALHIICINNNSKVVDTRVISKGDEDSTENYPLKVLRAAMVSRVKNIILCHNHPSGNLEPSNEDITNTHRIAQLLDAADIKLIDHIICYRDRYTSFSERGMLEN